MVLWCLGYDRLLGFELVFGRRLCFLFFFRGIYILFFVLGRERKGIVFLGVEEGFIFRLGNSRVLWEIRGLRFGRWEAGRDRVDIWRKGCWKLCFLFFL